MNKKGQVTLFVIIAIVIVVLGFSFFMFKDKLFLKSSNIHTEEVSTFVQNCIEKSLPIVINEIAESGGYFFSPKYSTESGTPYYYFNNYDLSPSLEQIESELSENLEVLVSLCAEGSQNFTDLKVEFEEANVFSKIEDNKILFSVEYPVNITKEENTYFLKDFGTFEQNTEFKKFYDISQKIILSIQQENSLCMSCFSNFALENDLSINIENPYNQTFIFSLQERNNLQNKFQLKFKFAIEYEN